VLQFLVQWDWYLWSNTRSLLYWCWGATPAHISHNFREIVGQQFSGKRCKKPYTGNSLRRPLCHTRHRRNHVDINDTGAPEPGAGVGHSIEKLLRAGR
jgi:hypothetical protein